MPSPAAVRFADLLHRGQVLRGIPRYTGSRKGENQIHYHASLATTVAAWESYMQEIVQSFFTETADPQNYSFHALHTIAREEAERKLMRFHTPNWENARSLLTCIGYDPIQDWTWARRGLGTLQVREFMNEILRVRHSFAHGHAMPTFSWNRSRSGRVRLTIDGLRRVESFFSHLVRSTDAGVARLIRTYGRPLTW